MGIPSASDPGNPAEQAKKLVLSGGIVKALTPEDVQGPLRADEANVKLKGPGTILFSELSYAQLKEIARRKGLSNAGHPEWVRLILRVLPEATYLCITPVEANQGGIALKWYGDPLKEPPVLTRLGRWFQRNGHPLTAGLTRVSYTEAGEDEILSECLVANLTAAKPVPKEPRKKKDDGQTSQGQSAGQNTASGQKAPAAQNQPGGQSPATAQNQPAANNAPATQNQPSTQNPPAGPNPPSGS